MSEEKTRIIPRKRSDAPSAAPRRLGDKIVFFCPNGDKIVVPANLAGKRGLCTKCRVPVVIPAVSRREAEEAVPVLEPVEEPVAEPVAEGVADEAAVAAAPAESAEPEVGKPEVGEPTSSPPPVGPAWGLVADAEASHAGLEFGLAGGTEATWPSPAPGHVAEGMDHPAARLVARLWVERGHGGIVEVHLSGGSVILPDWYEPNWSRGTHGLFASQAADGSVTLSAVAWDTIEKIIVRQVQGLPDGMVFE